MLPAAPVAYDWRISTLAIEVRGNAAQTDLVGTLRANRLSPRGATGLV